MAKHQHHPWKMYGDCFIALCGGVPSVLSVAYAHVHAMMFSYVHIDKSVSEFWTVHSWGVQLTIARELTISACRDRVAVHWEKPSLFRSR